MSNKENNTSRIGQDFTLGSLLKFALPGLLTSLTSRLFETLDDGLFISRYVGQNALAGIKITMPIDFLIMGLTSVFGMGASTYAAHEMGAHNKEEASRIFTRMTIMGAIFGITIAAVVIGFQDQILALLGADPDIMQYTETYVDITFCVLPIKLITFVFNAFYNTAGKPSMSLFNSVLSGVTNFVTDIVTIVLLHWGVSGAAVATALGFIGNFITGLVFYSNKKNEIHFVKPDGKFLETWWESFKYSASQVLQSCTGSLTSFMSNSVIIQYLGSDGIAAHAIINDLRAILNSAFMGYNQTVGPILAYNYGAKRPDRIKKLLGYNLTVLLVGCCSMMALGQIFKTPLLSIFISTETSSQAFYDLTYRGLTIEFLAPVFSAGCMMTNRIFVAFRNQKVATFLSMMRNLVFRLSCCIIIPKIWGADGVWWNFPVAEMFSFAVCAITIYLNRNNYGYGKSGEHKLIDTSEKVTE